jgi:hypothetical protein
LHWQGVPRLVVAPQCRFCRIDEAPLTVLQKL